LTRGSTSDQWWVSAKTSWTTVVAKGFSNRSGAPCSLHSAAYFVYQSGGFARKAETSSEESPFLMPVMSVVPEPACLAGFSLALDPILALESSMARTFDSG
jgi:hypothetical protein